MTERTFRIIIGACLLLGLYFDVQVLIWSVIVIFLIQGITNWRVPRLISRLRYGSSFVLPSCCGTTPGVPPARINFESERMLCLAVAALLILSYGYYYALLWVVPWFLAFALFGAGLSGLCPMVLALKRLGFR
ncbi:MAG: hypothetical protein OEV31_02835 [Gammaproteobacteria bacterium]|nr:hypothetical protein [Gammaproteobacteria bacterium]